jgi:hypothetical protein
MRRFLVISISLFAVLEALFFVWAVREQQAHSNRLSSLAARLQEDLSGATDRAERATSELQHTRGELAANTERLTAAERRAEELQLSLTMVAPDPLCPLPDPSKILSVITNLFENTVGRAPSEHEVTGLMQLQGEVAEQACIAQTKPAGQDTQS